MPKSHKNKCLTIVLATFGSVVVIDQISKILIRHCLNYGDVIEVIPNFFNITYRLNNGAAFSMFSTSNAAPYILSAIALVAILFIFRLAVKTKDLPLKIAVTLGLIAGGAGGNMVDRFFKPHQVVDFLDCYYGTYHWPAFNIADSSICIGATLILLISIFTDFDMFASDKSPKKD